MNIATYLMVFGTGLVAGMIIIVVALKIHSGKGLDFFDQILRIFSMISGAARRRSVEKVQPEEFGKYLPQAVDPREQNLYDSAQTIRKILLTLTSSIQRTDKATSDSSVLLGGVKSSINTLDLPTDLGEAQSLLLKEIDLVLSSNASLRGELAKSQSVLTEQQQQIEDLRTAVRIDGLTQLANRAYFDEKLNEMIELHKRYGDPFSLMMIDLDNFKGINDTYGHPAGDRILKGAAVKIKASLRGSDFLARFGGDEYALILIKTDAAAAIEVARKLCDEVRSCRFLLDDNSLSMTLSIGVAEVSKADDCDSLLLRADKALYRTKADGRNGVSVA